MISSVEMSSRSFGLLAGFFVSQGRSSPELPLDELRVFGKKKDAPLQPDFVGPLFDLAFQ